MAGLGEGVGVGGKELHIILFQNNDRRRKRNNNNKQLRSKSKQENPPLQGEVGRKVRTHHIPRNLQPPALWFDY